MINTTEYNLPDIQLLEKKTNQFLVWTPDKPYIVLGASNRADEALHVENVKQDNIAVLKRPSGGQTVMLTPNILLIAAVYFNHNSARPKEVFTNINSRIVEVLQDLGIRNLSLMGISDIAISGRKILGSAIYRNNNALLYHAVLNIGEPASTFERYLKHPVKEPDYRRGRSHSEFVTSLRETGFLHSFHHLAEKLTASFANHTLHE